jgi:uncharacterized membrane protein
MAFSFSFWDLALWFATSSLVMLVASELLAPYFGRKTVFIDVKKLRVVAIIFSIAFIFTIAVRLVTLTNG